ncbi:MAG: hypothetical protein ACFFER_19245, partial [Candidatus Thorarchaeota archaeon]
MKEVNDKVKSANNEIAKLGNKILKENLSKSVKIGVLLSRNADARLLRAIALLERKAKVYVERNPPVSDGVLRSNLQSSDLVYFGTYPTINRRSLMYRTAVEYGDFTINHILGCTHGCMYPCYAMQLSKRYGRISNREDWMHPRLVGNALRLLEEEIPKFREEVSFVHLSFMTDPFMYDAVNHRTYPWIERLTLRILERLNKSGLKTTVLTKGRYPAILATEKYDQGNEYGITMVSMKKKFHDEFEPFSISPIKRLNALKRLHLQGLKTWVSIEPYPTPNIVTQDFGKLLDRVQFVDKLIFGKWNYNPKVNGY